MLCCWHVANAIWLWLSLFFFCSNWKISFSIGEEKERKDEIWMKMSRYDVTFELMNDWMPLVPLLCTTNLMHVEKLLKDYLPFLLPFRCLQLMVNHPFDVCTDKLPSFFGWSGAVNTPQRRVHSFNPRLYVIALHDAAVRCGMKKVQENTDSKY